jgi:hypothetical protein
MHDFFPLGLHGGKGAGEVVNAFDFIAGRFHFEVQTIE